MDTAQRITTIRRCVHVLADEDWGEIDFLLEQFGAPTTEVWQGDKASYVRRMLSSPGVTDSNLIALDAFLGRAADTEAQALPWTGGGFRAFLTHVAQHKVPATELKAALAFYGIDAFVAHDDIRPGTEWIEAIIAALRSCEALVALLHAGFRESD